MLFELIIFAIVLVVLQTAAVVVIFKVMTSRKFVKGYTKTMTELIKEMQDELEDLL